MNVSYKVHFGAKNFFKISLFIYSKGRVTHRVCAGENHPLAHSPKCYNGQYWARPRPGIMSFFQMEPKHASHLLLLSRAYQQDAGWEMEPLRLKPKPICNVGTASASSTYATVLDSGTKTLKPCTCEIRKKIMEDTYYKKA